jgi:hypothetical protein
VVCKSKAYQEAKKAADEVVDYFEKVLSKEDYERLDALLDNLALARSEENGEHFKYGFAMGMRLMQEVQEYPDFQKKE